MSMKSWAGHTWNITFYLLNALLMNPWMAESFSVADFIEIDSTFQVLTELPNLINGSPSTIPDLQV